MISIVLKLKERVNIYYWIFVFALKNKGCIEKVKKKTAKNIIWSFRCAEHNNLSLRHAIVIKECEFVFLNWKICTRQVLCGIIFLQQILLCLIRATTKSYFSAKIRHSCCFQKEKKKDCLKLEMWKITWDYF